MTDNDTSIRLRLGVEPANPPVVHARGELDYRNCDQLGAFLNEVIDEHGPTIRLELAALEFVDSSGIKALGVAAKAAAAASGSLIISSLGPQLLRVLEVTGFRELFEIPPDCRIVRKAEPEEPAEGELCDFHIAPGADACRTARDSVCDFAENLGFNASAVDDIRLAVGEAFSNAVRHGQAAEAPIQIRCREIEDRLLIELKYPGDLFYPDRIPLPTAESGCEGGMGIYFMRLVMDAVEYDFRDGYTHLVLEKRR